MCHWPRSVAVSAHAERHLIVDRDSVGLAATPELRVDAVEFDKLLQAGQASAAVELCRGELPSGFEEEWALVGRNAHRESVLEVFEQLAGDCDAAGELDGASEWSRREIAVDPLSEPAHRGVITRPAAAGDRAHALVVYGSSASACGANSRSLRLPP